MTYKANTEYEIKYINNAGNQETITITPEEDMTTPAMIKEIQSKVDDFFKLVENKLQESYTLLESDDEDDEDYEDDEDEEDYDDELIGKDLFYILEDFSTIDEVDPHQVKFINLCNTELKINENLSDVTDWVDDKRVLKVVREIQDLTDKQFMKLINICYGEKFYEEFDEYVNYLVDTNSIDTDDIEYIDLEEAYIPEETIDEQPSEEDQTQTQLDVEDAIENVENPTQEEILAVNITNSTIDVLIQDEKSAIAGYNEFLEQAKATLLPSLVEVLEKELAEIIQDEEDHIAKLETIKSAFHLDENPVETESDVVENVETIEESLVIDDEEDMNSLEKEYEDAYHKALDFKTVPCVIARDKLMSGWGRATDTNHYQVVLCGSMDEANQIEDTMKGKASTEQLANIRVSYGAKTPSKGTVAYAVGRNASAWNYLSDEWYAKEFDNQETITENVEQPEIKVKSFDRYDNGMEVDIIIGQLEDGRYFEMLADTTTGISIFKQGFNPMTVEGKWILDGEESENQELDNEILANNTELSFEPKENKELWNTIVKDIDTSLMLETDVKYYYYEINFDYTEDTGKDSDGYSIFFKSTTDVDDYEDIINLGQELNELDEDDLADVDYIYYAQQIDEDEYLDATRGTSLQESLDKVGAKAQELVDLCKKAYAEKDLESAYKYWSEIYDLFLPTDEKEYNALSSEERFERFKMQQKYMDQFSDEEVYAITDYGKAQAYKEMGY